MCEDDVWEVAIEKGSLAEERDGEQEGEEKVKGTEERKARHGKRSGRGRQGGGCGREREERSQKKTGVGVCGAVANGKGRS